MAERDADLRTPVTPDSLTEEEAAAVEEMLRDLDELVSMGIVEYKADLDGYRLTEFGERVGAAIGLERRRGRWDA